MDLCESEFKKLNGFLWLTHIVNYSSFPSSLKIICVFETNKDLALLTTSNNNQALFSLIKQRLSKVGISLKPNQVMFDSDEDCVAVDNGNWSK